MKTNIKNVKTLFAKLFGPVVQLLIEQYLGRRSTENLILLFNHYKKTPDIANIEINVSMNQQFMVLFQHAIL